MTTYYVSTRGNNGNSGLSIGDAWASIQYAAGRVGPGDTVKVEAGTYNELIDIVGVSGASGSPITFEPLDINAKPRIRYNTSGPKVTIEDSSFFRWRGFVVRDFTGKGLVVMAKTRNIQDVIVDQCEFIDCAPSDSPGHMIKVETWRATYTAKQIHCTNNYFYNCSPTRPKDPNTGRLVGNEIMTFVGNVKNSSMRGNVLDRCWNIGLNLIGFDRVKAPAVYKGMPSHIVISNNLILNTYNTTGGASIYHDRALGPSLIENNIVISDSVVNGVFIGGEEGNYSGNNLAKGKWESNIIIRNNVFSMGYMTARLGLVEFPQYPAHDIVFAHNVVITRSTSNYRHHLAFESVLGLVVKNNVLEHRNPNNGVVVRSDAPDSYSNPTAMANTWKIDGNLWYSVRGSNGMIYEWPGRSDITGWDAWKTATGQGANDIYGQPIYVDEAGRDYHLTAGSPGNGAAIPLTYTVGAGSSSATLKVQDSRYFSDGMYVVGGDRINVGGTEATVIGVDWATHTLTLDAPISWSDGDPVHYVYSGTAPSMGLTDTVGTGDPVQPPTDPGSPSDPVDPPPPPAGGVDVLNNSEFDANVWGGSGEWNKYTSGVASFSISNGQCTINVTDNGGNTQLYQPGFEIIAGEDYECIITAQSAGGSHNINVRVIQDDSPYGNLGLDATITITGTQQTFTLPFTATATEQNSRLQLRLPTTGEDVTFESIYLRRVTYTEGPPSGGEPGSVTVSVASGGDDGYWREVGGGYFNNTAWQLRVGDDSGTMRTTFLRFVGVDIPDGVTVTAAYLDLYCERADGGGWQHEIAFENSVNSAQPADSTDLNARSYLTPTSWTPPDPITINQRYQTSDLSSQIQSLVDSNGGMTNASLLVKLADPNASGTARLLGYESYEGANNVGDMTLVANLVVEWTTPGGPGTIIPTRSLRRTFRQTFRDGFSRG